jgi:hypothetical protein
VILSTIKAASLRIAAKSTATAAAISAPVAALAEGVLKAMLISKVKVAAALTLVVGGVLRHGVAAGRDDRPPSLIKNPVAQERETKMTFLEKMESFRHKLPEPQGLVEMNGPGVQDIDGHTYPDNHLRGIAARLGVRSRTECMLLMPYLKDRDPKMRRIAAFALMDALKAYPDGLPSGSLDSLDSEAHRNMVAGFVSGIERLDVKDNADAPAQGKGKEANEKQGIRAEVRGTLQFENGRGYYIAVKVPVKSDQEMRVWLWISEDKETGRKLEALNTKEVIAHGDLAQLPEGTQTRNVPPLGMYMGRFDIKAADSRQRYDRGKTP